jgi:hypothetical protein
MNIIRTIENAEVKRVNQGDKYFYCLKVDLEENFAVSKNNVKRFKGRCKEVVSNRLKRNMIEKLYRDVFEYVTEVLL